MTDHFSLLSLTIRFSSSIPDVLLEIPDPAHLTAAGLKQLIRQRLPHDLSTHRLRLIYAGKALDDASSLASSLNIAATLPRIRDEITSFPVPDSFSRAGDGRGGGGNGSGKDKGKAPVRDPPAPRLRTYIHCSIGDIILSPKELEAEAQLARVAEENDSAKWEGKGSDGSSTRLKPSSAASSSASASNILPPPRSSTSGSFATSTSATAPRGTTSLSLSPSSATDHVQSSLTASRPPPNAPGPRGFDRLLDAGFTAAEVSALRSQFLALQSLSHTPDTMPSGAELRRLEDIWMDEGGSAGSVEGEGGGGAGAAGGGGSAGIANYGVGSTSGAAGPLDDMLWGSVMGFFWPVGCGLWLLREQGVWSWRKGLAVFVGIVVNFGFGVVRFLN
ncbi:hypothetical protein RJZ56_001242 [Blastomyces dermatitidis]|uniref:Ubiquitin-like domain-containing protein n=2 Tax=Ajellomyces dermatitidis TaxID=5039 RepID=F2T7S7_AJEDA|nr:uncharacterized protein BDCG_08208 [Blastomyces dermatitidis ER-3]EEQ84939.1 hypothetical protein BDCG_08208 [Blastomyces dermatitidis ER-3]EGE79290.1 hypothetical protein BDDG_02229 [Blastomyces dermatitidis ATCC 18188]